MNDQEHRDRLAIEEQFPNWEAWVSLHGQWRARLKHSEPVLMLFDDTPAGLLSQIADHEARHP